jgi:membrane-bound inhibitor of C-type lysozyme
MRFWQIVLMATLLIVTLIGCQKEAETTNEDRITFAEKSANIPDFNSISTDQVFVYSCGDSIEFTTHATPDSAWLFLADTTVKVLPTRSASGARYEGGKYLFWSKGNEAILQKPVGSFMQCETIPQEKVWAAAKLRGIDFRALGQEPGWFVEITQSGQTQYVGNYGEDTLKFDTPQPHHNEDGDTIYKMQSANNILEVVIKDTACSDVMSGFEHPQTVTITVGNTTTYSGCGRYLN